MYYLGRFRVKWRSFAAVWAVVVRDLAVDVVIVIVVVAVVVVTGGGSNTEINLADFQDVFLAVIIVSVVVVVVIVVVMAIVVVVVVGIFVTAVTM